MNRKMQSDASSVSEAELSETCRSLPIELLRAREVVMDRFRPLLSAHNLTEQQWRVLRVLKESGELDATKLASRANVLRPSLTRIIKLLESRGLIKMRKDRQDGRRALSQLTPLGIELIAEVSPKSIEIHNEIENICGSERLNNLLDDLETLINALLRP